VREYDLFIPLNYNDGSPVEQAKLRRVRDKLLKEFTGFTFFPQAGRGYWKTGGATSRDAVVIYRVLAANRRNARRVLQELKVELQRDLRQEKILIVERAVQAL
jgi:hypothetical protein